jgi:hypothetical protein
MHMYFEGLRYTLLLNAMGIGLLVRAWQGDISLFRGATYAPRWFLALIGLVLQVPGLFYLGVGAWAVCSSPGVHCYQP